jgi:hypothetical protein
MDVWLGCGPVQKAVRSEAFAFAHFLAIIVLLINNLASKLVNKVPRGFGFPQLPA